jgi:site-specific DNA recombinase
MKPAVLYARVSSREQQQEGYSIEAQVKLLRSYAAKSRMEIVREFIDIESAKAAGRKAFGEMLSFLGHSKNCSTILVEKTDRLSRNFEDEVSLNRLDLEIHFVKTGTVLSKNARAQTKFMHGIELVSSKYYSDNLREEVMKGMHEKAEQGILPAKAPFGYRNNKADRTIEVHPENSLIVKRMFALYASGACTLVTMARTIHRETGKKISKTGVHLILQNHFYVGLMTWGGKQYPGTHGLFVTPQTFNEVQAVLAGHNRLKYSKREVALRGLMNCAHDGCMLTGDIQKKKYVYYRCTGHRGKCGLPRFREEDMINRLGEPLKNLQVPPEIVSQIVARVRDDQRKAQGKVSGERTFLESRLASIRNRMDKAYSDKLDGKIAEDFWQRLMTEWRMEEQQVKMAIQGLSSGETGDRALDAQRIFELANSAYFLYVSQDSVEKAKLLRMVVSNFSVDAVSVTPTYRKPFDIIAKRAQSEEWSGREDSNLRPPGPEPFRHTT